MIAVGQDIADYRLLRILGEGGMGVVYEAERSALGARVALKVLAESVADDPGASERFKQEAKAAAAINHPNVVKVFDYGLHEGRCYYAMQLVCGLSLADLIRRRRGEQPKNPGPTAQYVSEDLLPAQDANSQAEVDSARPSGTEAGDAAAKSAAVRPQRRVSVADQQSLDDVARRYTDDPYLFAAQAGLQAARGLAEAHRHDLVHRDVKPSNLMIDRHGQVYVIDFGLVRSMSSTRSGFRRGTLRYMSPEQLDLDELDERTDVYSLGASLYQLISGEPPFDGQTESAVAAKIRAGRFRTLLEVAPECPLELARIVERALKHRRQERFTTAEAMADALQRFVAGPGGHVAPTAPRWDETPTRAFSIGRRDRWRKPLMAATCVLIGLFVWSGFSSSEPGSESQADENPFETRISDELPHITSRPANYQFPVDPTGMHLIGEAAKIQFDEAWQGWRVDAPEGAFVLLGSIEARDYDLSVDFGPIDRGDKPEWLLGPGLVIGYGNHDRSGGPGSRFQCLVLRLIPGRSWPRLERVLGSGAPLNPSGLYKSGHWVTQDMIDEHLNQLALQVRDLKLTRVTWNGAELPDCIVTEPSAGVADQDYQGGFGVVAGKGATLFRNFEVKVLKPER